MASLVLCLLGPDRAGLVEALAVVVDAHGGSWQRSHMTELAGTFAGVVQVHVDDAAVERFRAALVPLAERGVLDVAVAAGEPDASPAGTLLAVRVVGNDRPGIVREVSAALASHDVSIVDLQTWTASAAHAGGELFHAHGEVLLPPGLTADDLVAALEELSDDLMVDVERAPAGTG